MADDKQLEDHHAPEGNVKLSQVDADYIYEQLTTVLQRGRDGQRPGSHLLKRLRRSRAVLAAAIESSPQPTTEAPEPTKGFWDKLFSFKR